MSSPPSIPLWVTEQNKLKSGLPKEIQDIMKKHEDAGTTTDKEYEAAVKTFYDCHLCKLKPMPPDLLASFEGLEKDPTVYHTMCVMRLLLSDTTYIEVAFLSGTVQTNFTLSAL
jgi:L-proline amide hydrolase